MFVQKRSKLTRSVLIPVVVGAALMLGAASVAWACISRTYAGPLIDAPQPNQAEPASEVQVTGANWSTKGMSVRIVWDGAGNAQLAAATPDRAGSFSVAVAVPADAAPGLYSITATQGSLRSTPVRLEVLAPGSSDNSGGGGSPATTPGSSNARTSGSAGSAASAPAPSAPSAPAEPNSAGGTASSPAPSALAAPAGPNSGAPAAQPVPVRGGALPTVAAPSASPQPAANAADGRPVQAQPGATPDQPSRDLWSGFARGLGGNAEAPSLSRLPSTSTGNQPLQAGMGFLVAGLVAMSVGFGAAELHRRARSSAS